jgi:hypothetical protein
VKSKTRNAWKIAGEYIVVEPTAATAPLVARVREVLAKDKDLPSKCLMIINATKISWWQTNHHAGPARTTTYVKKACDTAFVYLSKKTEASVKITGGVSGKDD